MSDSLDSYAKLEELNKKFASFFERRNEEKEPHVLEIIKRNNRETIMVNLLAFFIQNKYHDIGDDLYQNLLKCINNKSEQLDYGKLVSVKTEQSTSQLLEDESKESTAQVQEDESEQSTAKSENKINKRIDMVMETEKAIIIIEAKVNHVLNNDLKIYADYAKKLKEKKHKVHLKKIILSKWQSNSLESFRESKEQEKSQIEESNNKTKESTDQIKNLEKQIEESKDWIEIFWQDVLDEELSPSKEPYKHLFNSMVKSMKGDEYLTENEIKIAEDNFEQIAKTFEFAKTIFKLQDEKAKKLFKVVKNQFTEDSKTEIWRYSKPFDEGAFVPRVVIEREGEYVIDICVDIRGYQFVILKRNNNVNEDDVKPLVEELEYDCKQFVVKEFDDPTEKESKRVIIHDKKKEEKKKEKSEYLFKKDNYSTIAKFAKTLYEKINSPA